MARPDWSRETVLTPWGFKRLADVPSQDELSEYYATRYYQEDMSIYQGSYDELESRYLAMLIERKHRAVQAFAPEVPSVGRYLDVGCGEGFSMAYFQRCGWEVFGLDFSIAGLRNHHPELEPVVTAGDLFELLDSVMTSGDTFDVVWLDNVLEHVRDPLELLSRLRRIVSTSGALVVEVPNDFSVVQQDLAARGLIEANSWVFPPDHISYFSRAGLTALAGSAGWRERGVTTNVPIDWFLYHPGSNYYADPTVGKDTHRARMMIEMLIGEQEPAKVLNLGSALADLGLGREIMAVFTAADGA